MFTVRERECIIDAIYDVEWGHVEQHLRHYVYIAPVIAPEPENVAIMLSYWDDLGVKLAWDGTTTFVGDAFHYLA